MSDLRSGLDARYVVLGGGAGGSLLVRALATSGIPGPVVLVDDGSTPIDERVWSSWRPVTGGSDSAVGRSWRRLVVATHGGERELGLRHHRYVAVRGRDLRAATDASLQTLSGERLNATVFALRDDGDGVVVSTTAGELRADFAFDAIGLLPARPSTCGAWMSFEGWEVESAQPMFDPGAVRLMDFRVPQDDGVAFLHTLPWSSTHALVEFTRISSSPARTSSESFLRAHLDLILGIDGYRVRRREEGVFPLRPRVPRPRTARCLAVGAAAGLVKASTGYGYQLMRQDSARLAEQVRDGEELSGLRRASRHRAMDAVFLELAVHDPATLAPSLELLFARNSADLVLRFLSEATTLTEEARLVSSLPVSPFLRAALRTLT
jgi:lycopene beta-cyclase